MRLVMTVMVRDEADVIERMLDHHLAQGVDLFVVTDNGSVDGTTGILERYAAAGVVDLRHDPVHRKQQGTTVTGMARDAAVLHGADWVLNADADEFWTPVDRSATLRSVFERIPVELGAFPVPVVDMTGSPAFSGPGLDRLVWRDDRPLEELSRVGLHAHSTSDVAHVGSADVTVVQGNHYVDIVSNGNPDPALAIEVLHLPWRSYEQYRRKVENAGKAYESNPELTPSPNHHGMREYRRLLAGTLYAWYVARHPLTTELADGSRRGWYESDRAVAGVADIGDGTPIDDLEIVEMRRIVAALIAADEQAAQTESELRRTRDARDDFDRRLQHVERELGSARTAIADSNLLLDQMRKRRAVRLIDGVSRRVRRLPGLRRP